jgi:hypothetical protein
MKKHRKDEGRLAGRPKCPTCETVIDGFSGVGNDAPAPKDGDVSFCAYCGQSLEARGEQWVKLEGADLAEALTDPRVKLAHDMVKAHRKEHGN